MIKFVLILHLCSTLSGECLDSQYVGELPDHYTCVKAGYVEAGESIMMIFGQNPQTYIDKCKIWYMNTDKKLIALVIWSALMFSIGYAF